eukprot:2326713-Amphidinium_carterae.1
MFLLVSLSLAWQVLQCLVGLKPQRAQICAAHAVSFTTISAYWCHDHRVLPVPCKRPVWQREAGHAL